MSDKCINWMRYDAIRETVANYNRTWSPHNDVPADDLSEFNMTRNCMECNMRPDMSPEMGFLFQVADIFKDSTLLALEKVGMRRKCYKSNVIVRGDRK